MAPSSASAKPRKPATSKAGNSKPIVPAIPLPYVKRQAAAARAAAAQNTTGPSSPAVAYGPASPSVEKVNGHISSLEPTETPTAAAIDQASAIGNENTDTKPGEDIATPSPESTQLENGHTDDSGSTFDFTNESADSPSSSVPGPGPEEVKSSGPQQSALNYVDTTHNHLPTSASGGSMGSVNQTTAVVDTPTTFSGQEDSVRLPPSLSPNRYQMPPPFHPANRPPPGMTGNGNMAGPLCQPMPNGPPMHHSHPSNGSTVQFGMYSGSATSSPAPHSGGTAPRPGMPLSDGRTPYIVPASSGYPPVMPMGSDIVPVTHYEGYGGQNMAYAPAEHFQPYPNGFGPSTPHSLHGSQSSGHPDESLAHISYQTGHSRNGPNGFSQDFQVHGAKDRMMMNPQDYPRMSARPGHQHHLAVQEDISEGLMDYLRQQFGNPDLSDCVVELRFADNRRPAVRVPGHRLILARSSVLNAAGRRQSAEQRLLTIETDSKWIQPDAFYMAMQRLYGLPLLSLPPPSGMNGTELAEAGSMEQRFDFALAYAASGKLLEWEPVLHRACEIASHLLDWQTIEKALEFALEGFADKGTYETYKYEVGSKILLHGIANFVVHNIPPTFSLDTTVQEAATYSRLPMDPGTQPKQSSEEPVPVVVRGSQNAQTGRGHRHQLSNIQFGDLSLIEGGNGSASDTPKASQQARPISHVILSRVLLSVPFNVLHMIIDPMRANGWANAETRQRIVHEAVIEREARRKRVIDAVLDGRVRDSYQILQQLRAPDPRILDRWGTLAWQEEVLSHSTGEGPSLARRWAPIQDRHNVPVAEFP